MSLEIKNIANFDIHSDEFLHLVDSLDSEFSNTIVKKDESCYSCGSDDIYIDSTEGKTICLDCGLTLNELLDRSTDWASINSTNDNNSRCGCPTNYYFPQSSLGTKASNGKFSRISILERWSQMPYKERSRLEVLKYIDLKCSSGKVKISQPIIDNAKNLFNKLSMVKHSHGENEGKNIIIRGLNRKSIISACLLNGANLQGKPMTPKEVAEIFEITEKQVTKGNRKFRDMMINQSIVNNIKSSQSEEYIDRKETLKKLKLDDRQIMLAKKIAKNVKKLDIASDHQPASLAAGSVLLMASIFNLNLSKKVISETFKISQVTIVKTFRKIYDYRKILISDDATDKVIKLSNKTIEQDTTESLVTIEEKDYESDESEEDDDEVNEDEIKNLFISSI